MPTLLIAEPVPETRELLIHLAQRQGWVASAFAAIDVGPVDALLFEPLSRLGQEAREHVLHRHPSASLVAVTVAPAEAGSEHGAHHMIAQPFAPDELARVLRALLAPASRTAAA